MRIKSLLVGLTLACAAASAQAQESQPKWGASIDFEGKAGTKRSLGEADMLVPFWQDNDTLLFGNARFRLDDNDSKEGNFGLGLRHMLGDWNLGTYGYFDRRETGNENIFNQATFGAEALGTDFDLRANSYWPLGETKKNADALSTATLSGTSVIFRGGEERAFRGFDAELGWRVPVNEVESPYDFRVYGGGYHFYDPDGVAPDVTGPRLRAEFTSYEALALWKGTRLTLGAEVQDDDVRGRQGFVSVRLRIPLQSDAQRNRQLTAQERRMTTPIVRDIDIVAQAGAYGAAETATQTANGSAISIMNSGATNGQAAMQTALTNAGANSTVILSGSFATTAELNMQSGQTLVGGSAITVRSPSGRTAVLNVPGATLTGTDPIGTTSTVNMAANSALIGMTIRDTQSGGASNSIAVIIDGVTGVRIVDSVISATATGGSVAQGVQILNGGSAAISGSTVTATSGTSVAIALQLANNNSSLVAQNSTFTATATSGSTVSALTATVGTNKSLTLIGSTLNASNGSPTNLLDLANVAIVSGSTGNVRGTGACTIGAGVTGSVSFTNGTTCP